MTRLELQNMLSKRANELVYSYERLSNGSCEYLVFPYERGREIEGAPMRYKFNEKESEL